MDVTVHVFDVESFVHCQEIRILMTCHKIDIVVNIICKIINLNRLCMTDLVVFRETS